MSVYRFILSFSDLGLSAGESGGLLFRILKKILAIYRSFILYLCKTVVDVVVVDIVVDDVVVDTVVLVDTEDLDDKVVVDNSAVLDNKVVVGDSAVVDNLVDVGNSAVADVEVESHFCINL